MTTTPSTAPFSDKDVEAGAKERYLRQWNYGSLKIPIWENEGYELQSAFIETFRADLIAALLSAQSSGTDVAKAVAFYEEWQSLLHGLQKVDDDACINIELCERDDGGGCCIASYSISQLRATLTKDNPQC